MVLPNRQAKITDFVKKACHNYFGVKLRDQDKPFAPHVCCKTCIVNMRDWRNGKRKSMPFAIPMVCREGKDPLWNCYFCMIDRLQEQIPRPNPDILSVIRSIPYGPDLPISKPDGNIEYSSNSEHGDMTVVAEDDAYKPEEDNQPVPLTQAERNDLKRDLNISKEYARCWVHVAKRNICWHQEQCATCVTWYPTETMEVGWLLSSRWNEQ